MYYLFLSSLINNKQIKKCVFNFILFLLLGVEDEAGGVSFHFCFYHFLFSLCVFVWLGDGGGTPPMPF
jgi:hypothetical protein